QGIRSSLEIFDPATLLFSSAGALSSPRKAHGAAVLPDGRVLIVGGADETAPLSSSDIFDPATGAVSRGPELSTFRAGLSATTLLSGKVLVAGGNDGTADLASAETYDPATNAFAPTAGALGTARRDHRAFLLPHNNGVLIVGGTSNSVALSSAEL